ncbi:TatD family hydrolase [Candidatus Saccharibacteria bacterium]|nr:TatD family hydrolase [Candidatus Saccharibacteria bacterium]MCB9834643.1 TatD family hydrolase [Candidatus Nomurabacteria bacterium]
MVRLVDTHAHLHDSRFEGKIVEVLEQSSQDISAVINLGTDFETSQKSLDIYQNQDYQSIIDIYWGAGLHPHHADDLQNLKSVVDLIYQNQTILVAVGEAGLDYYYLHATKKNQIRAFVLQAELAKELDKPLVVHARDAWDNILGVIDDIRPRGVIHSFTGKVQQVEQLVDLGFYFGISGIATFIKDQEYLEALRLIPSNRVVFETDCPYLAPVPMRGKLNIPAYQVYTLEFLARLRGEDQEKLAQMSLNNTRALFKVK